MSLMSKDVLTPTGAEDEKRLYFVSLGCPKNRVDSEIMLGTLAGDGYRVVQSADEADVLVVNTCSFVEDARQESVDVICELADLKAARPGRRLVVAGCLAQRYPEELRKELPEVDLFVGTGEYHRIGELLRAPDAGEGAGVAVARPYYVADHLAPRVLTTPSWTAYVKIAEGCSQRCTFCIIPKLRGKARSRSIESVVAEARSLAEQGVLELNLIAQDLTHYGDDLDDDGTTLAALLRELVKVDGLRWIRLLYCYPHAFTDELVELIASEPKICKYVDIPLQHVHDDLLARMQRRTTEAITRELLTKLRQVPDMVIRTTFIVGHPGETPEHFAALCRFVEEMELDRVGVFRYSPEDGTRSARQAGAVSALVKAERYHRIMEIQQGISRRRQEAWVGRTVEVLVEGVSEESELVLQGRFHGQAPDIDGVTYVGLGETPIDIGTIVPARIVSTGDYDLVARHVDEDPSFDD